MKAKEKLQKLLKNEKEASFVLHTNELPLWDFRRYSGDVEIVIRDDGNTYYRYIDGIDGHPSELFPTGDNEATINDIYNL